MAQSLAIELVYTSKVNNFLPNPLRSQFYENSIDIIQQQQQQNTEGQFESRFIQTAANHHQNIMRTILSVLSQIKINLKSEIMACLFHLPSGCILIQMTGRAGFRYIRGPENDRIMKEDAQSGSYCINNTIHMLTTDSKKSQETDEALLWNFIVKFQLGRTKSPKVSHYQQAIILLSHHWHLRGHFGSRKPRPVESRSRRQKAPGATCYIARKALEKPA